VDSLWQKLLFTHRSAEQDVSPDSKIHLVWDVGIFMVRQAKCVVELDEGKS
jgi:hypothetical protein